MARIRARARFAVATMILASTAVTLDGGSVDALVTTVGGGAYGISVKSAVAVGPTPSVTLPPGGGGPFTAASAGVTVPGVLKTGALRVTTRGAQLNTDQGFAQSSASASNVSVGAGVVTADQLTSHCRSGTAGSAGSVSVIGLRVGGALVESPAPDTVIELPGVARVVVNPQAKTDSQGSTAITVNALSVTLLAAGSGLPTGVVVAQARCSAKGPDVNGALCPCTLWPSSTVPSVVDAGDPGADVELGVKFRTDRAGVVTGIRFYKSASNVGPHTGSLWSADGERLATVTFVNETNSGWQEARFAAPVPVSPATTYTASYHTSAGHYSFDGGYFAFSGLDRPPLHALAHGVDGPTGSYTYGPSAFPATGNGGANYWVDVIFE